MASQYEMNPKYVANHMKDALATVREKKTARDPLYALLFGPEVDADYAEFVAYIQSDQPGWEDAVFGKQN